MARARSPLASAIVALTAAGLMCSLMGGFASFVPSPPSARVAAEHTTLQPAEAAQAVYAAALAAAATHPAPAWALEDEEEGFDLRILAVVALPLGAISWALFNVWRVAFRQVIRIGESASGSSKSGLGPED
mmetsp:Transcript_99940/g.291500  ORF Transcript_99940/g.291500 Transcript_99940/m.291500 type:complete len:131 (+) Transcript_99940:87-479(+)